MRRSREWGDYFCLLAYRHLVFSLDGRGRDACLPSVELYIPDGDSSKVGSRARLLLYVARDPVLCGVRQRRDTVRLLYNGTTHYDAMLLLEVGQRRIRATTLHSCGRHLHLQQRQRLPGRLQRKTG